MPSRHPAGAFSIRPDDASLREAMKAVAAERRRFGYRRIHVMLDPQGIVMNQKKLRRLYREEKLQVRRRGGPKRALGTRRPLLVPDRANACWSLDFVSDTLTDRRDMVPFDAGLLASPQDRHRGLLGAIVGDDRVRPTARG